MSSFIIKVIINRPESGEPLYDRQTFLIINMAKSQCNADGCEECLKIGSSRYVI